MSEGSENRVGAADGEDAGTGSRESSETPTEPSTESRGDGLVSLECDRCGEPVDIDDKRCEECGSIQLTAMSNIRKYGVLGVLGLALTYVFGVAVVNAIPPTDVLSSLLVLTMLAIALIGPLLLVVAALGYKRRKEATS